jgi:hypothetical protein
MKTPFSGGCACGAIRNAASLGNPRRFRRPFHIFTPDAPPWDFMNPALPQFEKYRPQEK